MPNWCYNTVVISHDDETLIDALEQELIKGETAQMFNHLLPRPAEEEENWYAWNINNRGTKWDVTPYDWDRNGNSITMNFDSAWSPPVTLYETLTAEGWNISAKYHEPGCVFIGQYEDGFDDYYEYDITDEDSIRELPEELIEFGNLLEEHENWKENNEATDETED
jgi:hypothetical protein